LTFAKLTKTPLIYNVSYFNLGYMERCLGGAKPTTDHPVATGLVGLFGPRVKAPAQ